MDLFIRYSEHFFKYQRNDMQEYHDSYLILSNLSVLYSRKMQAMIGFSPKSKHDETRALEFQ